MTESSSAYGRTFGVHFIGGAAVVISSPIKIRATLECLRRLVAYEENLKDRKFRK